MRILKGLGRVIVRATPYAMILLTVFVTIAVVTACQTDDLNQPGPVGAIARTTDATEQGLVTQLDKLDSATRDALVQFEYACRRGFF